MSYYFSVVKFTSHFHPIKPSLTCIENHFSNHNIANMRGEEQFIPMPTQFQAIVEACMMLLGWWMITCTLDVLYFIFFLLDSVWCRTCAYFGYLFSPILYHFTFELVDFTTQLSFSQLLVFIFVMTYYFSIFVKYEWHDILFNG